MKKEYDIQKMLTDAQPKLLEGLRARMWSHIKDELPVTTAPMGDTEKTNHVPSPFIFAFMHTRMMVPVAVLLTVLLGSSGIALASEPARPGDLLFPVDRALENMRLKIALSDEQREILLRDFSDERLRELQAIISEESRVVPSDNNTQVTLQDGEVVEYLEIEAYVYLDITVVKVELNDRKEIYLTHASTKDGVIDAVIEQLPFLTKEQVVTALNFETGNRESRAQDRGEIVLNDDGNARVSSAILEVLAFVDESGHTTDDASDFFSKLHDEVDGFNLSLSDDRIRIRGEHKRFEWKVESDGDERIEIREDGSRVRIENKDGEMRIEVKDDNDGDDFEDPSNDDNFASDEDDVSDDTSGSSSDDSDNSSNSGSSNSSSDSNDDSSNSGSTNDDNTSDDDDSDSGGSGSNTSSDDEEDAIKDAEDAAKKAADEAEKAREDAATVAEDALKDAD